SGFFLAPSALARFGTTALIGWAVMPIVAICLGMVFARLARIAPATGGPYAYTRMGFGRFAGFLVAWGYWISIWASLPAMAAALVGYLAALVPGLVDHRILAIGIALGAMWGVALVNLRPVRRRRARHVGRLGRHGDRAGGDRLVPGRPQRLDADALSGPHGGGTRRRHAAGLRSPLGAGRPRPRPSDLGGSVDASRSPL